MALTSVPLFVLGQYGGISRSNTLLDGQNERIGHCGYWATPDGATRHIEAICWATGTVTTGDDILCQIESIGADGLPAGIIGAGVSGTQTVADGDDNVYFETALGTHYDLTSGSWLAVTFKMTSAAKSLNIPYAVGLGVQLTKNFNWICTDIAGAATWVKLAGGIINVALKCSTGEYLIPLGGQLLESFGTIAIANNHDDPNIRYLGHKIVCGVGARLIGAMVYLDMDYDVSIQLTDSSGTLIVGDDAATNMDIAIDSEYRDGTSAYGFSFLKFPSPKTLTANTAYYLIFNPDSATDLSLSYGAYETEALKNQVSYIPSGWSVTYVQSFEPISYVETTTRICGILPVFDQMEFGGFAKLQLGI